MGGVSKGLGITEMQGWEIIPAGQGKTETSGGGGKNLHGKVRMYVINTLYLKIIE